MYVVRRPFKNFGKTLTAGSIIEDPAKIKRFKSKLADNKIVEVTEQTFEQYYNYFKEKFGVELKANKDSSDAGTPANDDEQNNNSDEQNTNSEVVQTAKPIVSTVTTVKVVAH